jgi:hypothetical protein
MSAFMREMIGSDGRDGYNGNEQMIYDQGSMTNDRCSMADGRLAMSRILRKYWAGVVLAAGIPLVFLGRAYLESGAWLPAVPQAPVRGLNPRWDTDYALVEEGLFVGGWVKKPPPGTQAVLSLCEADDPYREEVAVWRGRPIPDGAPAPSLGWLREQVAFVAQQRKAGHQVYVHCAAGMSRGPMVTAAYLMQEHKWSRDEALAFLHERWPVVGPNQYFMALLLQWEERVKEGDGVPAKEGVN